VADRALKLCRRTRPRSRARGAPGEDEVAGTEVSPAGVRDGGDADGAIDDAYPSGDGDVRSGRLGDGFVRGGAESISRTNFGHAGDPMFADPPGCWLNHQATFMQGFFPPGAAFGSDAGFFVMPPIDPGGDTPVFGGAVMAGALQDRPEVREFLRWVTSSAWGTLWAGDPTNVSLPYNASFDRDRCRATELPEAVNAMRVRLCREARDAVVAGLWRFDASDQMSPGVGAIAEVGTPGAFLQGMTDYVDRGPDSLDQILAEIDAARAQTAPD
jgi:alpha-glucoside transport system substrate-binding protein